MSQYFIRKGKEKKGPYSVYDLKELNILENTKVCTEDGEWDYAKNFPELLYIIDESPKVQDDNTKNFKYKIPKRFDRYSSYRFPPKKVLSFVFFLIAGFALAIAKKQNETYILVLITIIAFTLFIKFIRILFSSQPFLFDDSFRLLTIEGDLLISEFAKKNLLAAVVRILLYLLIPSPRYTSGTNIQTFKEKTAGFVLVKVTG